MGSYYFFKDPDPENEWKYLPVPEEEVFRALRKIAKKHRVRITDRMILDEVGLLKKSNRKKGSSPKRFLYIDGTNLFAGQYDLFGPNRVASFRSILGHIRKLFSVSQIFFYASYTPKQPKRRPASFFAAEMLFYREAKSTSHVIFYKGDRSPTSGKEKGVDVHLSVDLVKDGLLHRYDEAVIMTGDADLVYGVQIIRNQGIPVYAVFFPNRFSLGIAYTASSSTVLNYQKRFIKTKVLLPKSTRILPIKDPTCKQVG